MSTEFFTNFFLIDVQVDVEKNQIDNLTEKVGQHENQLKYTVIRQNTVSN
jgi:hypothetical protein